MSVHEQVANAKSPQEAMLHIATALDVLLEQVLKEPSDPWAEMGEWDNHEAHVQVQKEYRELMKVRESEDEIIVELPKPDGDTYIERLNFAEHTLKLDEFYAHQGAPDDGTTWAECYAKGGPLWLYTADRDAVMSYPYQVRAAMVADVERFDPKTAQEMGRDVLKHPSETGPGGVGMGTDLGR